MRRLVLQFILAVVTSMIVVGSLEDGNYTSPPTNDGAVSDETISDLIRQLADPNTAKRDAAAKQLIEIGLPAKAQLEAASQSDNELDVIRRRAKILLLSIVRRNRAAFATTGKAGKSVGLLPSWDKFEAVVGDTIDSRKLYTKMYRAEPTLLTAYATDLSKAKAEAELLCLSEQELSSVSLAAFMLVAGDKDISLSRGACRAMLKKTNSLSDTKDPSFFSISKYPNMLLFRKLAMHWLLKSNHNAFMLDSALNISLDHGYKEGLPLAVDTLRKNAAMNDADGEAANINAVAILIVGKYGNATHVKWFEPFLKKTTVLWPGNLATGKPDTQLRDFALAAAVHLTGQEMEDYGIAEPVHFSKINTGNVPLPFFFSARERQQALSKWAEWKTVPAAKDTADEKAVEVEAAK